MIAMMLALPMIAAAFETPADFINQNGLLYGGAIWANNVTNGWFWFASLMTFCFVLFIATSRYSTDRAFGYAGVVGLFGSLMLITLDLMDWKVGTIFIVLGIGGVAWMIVSRENV